MGKDIYTHCKGRSILIASGLRALFTNFVQDQSGVQSWQCDSSKVAQQEAWWGPSPGRTLISVLIPQSEPLNSICSALNNFPP